MIEWYIKLEASFLWMPFLLHNREDRKAERKEVFHNGYLPSFRLPGKNLFFA
jgi:hypothetical protein